jgi:site-specific DNA-methyltransferase (adenine-specific)
MIAKTITWKLEKRVVSDLKPYDKNPRIISESGKEDLRKSFDEIGQAQPININLDNTILSGHARTQVLLEQDPNQEVDVYVPDRMLTPKQEEAVIIRMNKNVAGTWDFEKLRDSFDFGDLMEWGFLEHELTLDSIKIEDYSDKNKEINTNTFGDDLKHECPKCGFEFND